MSPPCIMTQTLHLLASVNKRTRTGCVFCLWPDRVYLTLSAIFLHFYLAKCDLIRLPFTEAKEGNVPSVKQASHRV